jgi:hypothetical protein
MPPEHLKFAGGSDQTLLHPLVLVAMLVVIVLMFSLRRRYLIAPFLMIAVILAGLIRMMIRKPAGTARLAGGFDNFDKLFLAWALLHALAFILLFSQMAAVINQFGYLWDSLGAFFLLRFLIQDDEDIERAIRVFALIAAVVVAGMLFEHFRHVNVFGMLGGVRLEPEVRNGLVRAQGPFAHALLAGTFGAILLPLFFWLWRSGHSKTIAALGMAASTLIVFLTGSSTPVLAYAAGIGAVWMWPLRKRMRMVRWGIVGALVALHLVMKAPVWFLIGHIDVVGGSSASHRAYLVDLFIRHVGDWWLLGTDSNANWGWDMWDTANQYVSEGWSGGLAAFTCFLGLVSMGFSRIGRARKRVQGDRRQEWYFWLLGAALFANVIAFFGISYFDQTRIVWFALLSMISASTVQARQPHRQQAACERITHDPSLPCLSTPAITLRHDYLAYESHEE